MTEVVQVADPARMAARAGEFARIASILAEEASALALLHSGPGHASKVAARAAQQAHEAAETLRDLAARGADLEESVRVATWALSAAAVALTQAKLNTPLSTV
ncbi:MAG: hypothetical protein QOE90_894 [Thermoplasmata archaeon]|jgi:hypothetical protein|nr:hypothetical protein [Thermoplasmata archaeon]